MGNRYAYVMHSRWLETEEPKATVIHCYSDSDWRWFDICTCAPEWADEIATALNFFENHDLKDLSSFQNNRQSLRDVPESEHDEIVNSLRAFAEVADAAEGKSASLRMLGGKIFDDAADQIDRLSMAGDALVEAMRSEYGVEAAVEAWERIRHG